MSFQSASVHTRRAPADGRAALAIGTLAALLASTCCLGPLVLLSLGFSGAWIANLTLLEPYQPYFTAAALLALFFAWRHIWHPSAVCVAGVVCAVPSVRRGYKLMFVVVAKLVLIALVFPFIAPWFY